MVSTYWTNFPQSQATDTTLRWKNTYYTVPLLRESDQQITADLQRTKLNAIAQMQAKFAVSKL